LRKKRGGNPVNALENWVNANFKENLTKDICRAIFHFLRQKRVFVAITNAEGKTVKENLNGGEYFNSETLARILAKHEAGVFYDFSLARTTIAESGRFPLLKLDDGPEGFIIANPSPDPAKRATDPLVFVPGKEWVTQQVGDNPKDPKTYGQFIGERVPIDSGAPGDMEAKTAGETWDMVEGPQWFHFPDPLEPGERIENPAKTDEEWRQFRLQENTVEKEAREMVLKPIREAKGMKAYTNDSFVGCAEVSKGSAEWKAVMDVARKTVVSTEKLKPH
jgi:hypothetical protein